MKKVLTSLLLALFCLTLAAQSIADNEAIQREHLRSKKIAVAEREKDRNTNLYDKLPSAGYVGSVALEINAPGAYPESAGGVSTVHGFMVNPRVFLGLGAGYIHSVRHGEGVIPVFAETRIYFPSQYMRRIYPHMGVRLGAQIPTAGATGVYSQLACGFRVPVSEKLALNLEVGPQYVTKYLRGGRHDSTVTVNSPWKAAGYTFGFFGRLSLEF